MTLAEFLSAANADDELALAEAKSYTETTYRKIGANEARQFFSIMGALATIEANQTSTDVVQAMAGVDTTVGQLCKAVMGTISDGGQFATDPNTNDGQLNRTASSLIGLPQSVIDAFFATSEVTSNPFKDTTLEEVKRIRHAASWIPCDHGGTEYLTSTRQNDVFTMVANVVSPIENYYVRMFWRESDTDSWKLFNSEIPMKGHATELTLSQQVKRLGAWSLATQFKFEYLPPWAGAMSEVTVGI